MAENADPTMVIVVARRDGRELRVPRVSLENYSEYCSGKEYMLTYQIVIKYMLNLSKIICRFQFVPKDITVIIVWNLASVKMTSSCAIRLRAASVGMDIQVYTKYT